MIQTVENRILRIRAILELTGLSRSTLYRKIQDGSFPRQIKIAERCAGWREHEVRDWIAERQSSFQDR